MLRLLICFIFLQSLSLFGQDLCSDKQLKKQIRKVEKIWKKHDYLSLGTGDMTFAIAECYRQKNDTACLAWYKKSCDINKKYYTHVCKNTERKYKALKEIAYSLYYTQQYADASTYFAKCLYFCRSLQMDLNEYLFYYGDCQFKLNQYADALKAFTEYKTTGDNKHNVDELIKQCENK